MSDLSKDIRRFLLDHWSEDEINSRLQDPEYFFEQVVNPRIAFLRRSGEPAPKIRFARNPAGNPLVILIP